MTNERQRQQARIQYNHGFIVNPNPAKSWKDIWARSLGEVPIGIYLKNLIQFV